MVNQISFLLTFLTAMIGHFADRLQWCFIWERISIFERICNV